MSESAAASDRKVPTATKKASISFTKGSSANSSVSISEEALTSKKTMAASFFSSIAAAAQSAVQRFSGGMPADNFETAELTEKYLQKQQFQVLDRHAASGETFMLYHLVAEKRFHVVFVLTTPATAEKQQKQFSIYRSTDKTDAQECYSQLYTHCELFAFLEDEETLRNLVKTIHGHPKWSTVCHAAALGFHAYFDSKKPSLDEIVKPCDPEQLFPLLLAVQGEHAQVVRTLVKLGASPAVVDPAGLNAFHHAARTTPEIIEALATSRDTMKAINQLNIAGLSPLFIALLAANSRAMYALLQAGAISNMRCNGKSPLEEALKLEEAKSIECVNALIKNNPELISEKNAKNGDTLLHLAPNKELMAKILGASVDTNFNIDIRNSRQETALHSHAIRQDFQTCIKLLAHGSDVNAQDVVGSTPLHMAIKNVNETLVQTFLIFGADPNIANANGSTARHLAATTLEEKNREKFVRMLVACGARRCSPERKACSSYCAYDPEGRDESPPREQKTPADELQELYAFVENLCLREMQQTKDKAGKDETIVNLLALDGGGIRGLVLVQIMIAIEAALGGKPLFEHFAWVAGTSTGGILALANAMGKSLRDCQRLYFRFKDAVFSGIIRPYDTTILEGFIKRELSVDKTLADIKTPKLLITAAQVERHPIRLVPFRNYTLPCSPELNAALGYTDPRDFTIWRAARCTSAAPTYFSSVDGIYVDGGVIANNPTQDLLVDVQTYNNVLRFSGGESSCVRVGCVVSIGTGKNPEQALNRPLDVGLPGNPFDVLMKAFAVRDLGVMMVDQVCATDGKPVDRARAWCQMMQVPYFRFSTPLTFKCELDTKDDKVIVRMLWETVEYLYANRRQLELLAGVVGRAKQGSPS